MNFRAAVLGSMLFGISIPSPFTQKQRERPGSPKTITTATPTPAPLPGPQLSEADLHEFLHAWPVYESAIMKLGRDIPADAKNADPLEAASVAIAQSDAVRAALDRAGVESDHFLDLYRRTAQTWYAVQQSDEREETDTAIDAQVAELRKVAGRDPGAAATADRMKATRDAQEGEDSRFPPSDEAVKVVKSHRAELAKIFGAAE